MTKGTHSKLVYLDTSIFADKVLLSDAEDRKCAQLINRIANKEFGNYKFITSKFTLIELAELISRKKTKNKAKIILFDMMDNPDLPIYFVNPEPVHETWGRHEYFDINFLIRNLINTALDYSIPGFDTIHAHAVRKLNEKIIAVSKDVHFNRFTKIKNVTEVVTASEFLGKYK